VRGGWPLGGLNGFLRTIHRGIFEVGPSISNKINHYFSCIRKVAVTVCRRSAGFNLVVCLRKLTGIVDLCALSQGGLWIRKHSHFPKVVGTHRRQSASRGVSARIVLDQVFLKCWLCDAVCVQG
jgi:hypothetical protein